MLIKFLQTTAVISCVVAPNLSPVTAHQQGKKLHLADAPLGQQVEAINYCQGVYRVVTKQGEPVELSLAIIAYGSVDSGIFADSSYQVGQHRYSAVQVTVKSTPLGFKPRQRRVRRRVGTYVGSPHLQRWRRPDGQNRLRPRSAGNDDAGRRPAGRRPHFQR